MTGVALALASGQGILNNTVWNGPQRCWLWNLEDSGEELARSIQAAALHWQFEEADLEGRLYVDSGLDGAVLRLAEHDQRSGCCIVRPVAEALQEELRTRQIDVLIVDPFVSSHAVPENDNGAIDAVAKEWARIAVDANCAICLVHHARKGNGADVDADSARGASALVAAARFALALNTMSKDEAERFGIEEEDRRTYFRADNAKSNRAPAGAAEWYRLHSVALGNGWLDGGDHLPVAVPWSPPNPFDDVTPQHIAKVQGLIADGEWRESPQSGSWAGHAVADVLGLNADNRTDKARIKSILREWIANGVLKVERRKDRNHEMRPFVIVGRVVQP